MAVYNKFNSWVDYLVEDVDLASDQFVVALTNAAPSATDSTLSDISEISYTNLSSRNLTTTSSDQTGGTHRLILQDLTLTASGGPVGPFRYIVIYDDTVAGDPVVCWFDYGSSITLADGETLQIDLDGTNGLFSVT